MTYGFRGTIPGKSVTNPTDTSDPRNLLFSTDFNSLKRSDSNVNASQTTITTDGSGNGSTTIAHGLGYTPEYRVFAETVVGSGNWFPDTNANDPHTGFTHELQFYSSADSTNIYIKTISAANTPINTTFALRYYIFIDAGA